jgi:hypothetical protein
LIARSAPGTRRLASEDQYYEHQYYEHQYYEHQCR